MSETITADLLLQAYGAGIFPMAESQDDPEIHWIDPRRRGILPIRDLHISRSLRKMMRQCDWRISVDQDFRGVIDGCADRPETWINAQIIALYEELFAQGHAHSLELWDGDELIGGTYGVVLGCAFFGESMFSRRPSASKVALVAICDRLNHGGFELFDTQFLTPHLATMGGIEISRAEYQKRLRQAISGHACFNPDGYCSSSVSLLNTSLSFSEVSSTTNGV